MQTPPPANSEGIQATADRSPSPPHLGVRRLLKGGPVRTLESAVVYEWVMGGP